MKKVLLFTIAVCIAMSSFAQFGARMSQHSKDVAPMSLSKTTNCDLPVVGEAFPNGYVSNKSVLDDPVTAVSRYDVQTNGSAMQRCYLFPDGTMGATATWSTQDASWTDRGTGYNYFDGTAWGAQPTARVETSRVGWPNYCPFGPTGELVIAHAGSGPLIMNTRSVKGTGAWTQTTLPALPSGMYGTIWPRVVTNGTNHTNIHIIALTTPTANSGTVYNGMNGALVYSHSLDGGTTWSPWIQPSDLNSTNYAAFGGDTYSWAAPHGDTLAFTIGDGFYDQMLLKSTDNGTTWNKTVIYHSPYNLTGSSPSYFYCPDGCSAIQLDNQGMAHVIFGLAHDSGTNTAWYYNIYENGLVYWDESQPQLRQDMNPDSLFATGNLVGWVKDTNVFHLPVAQMAYWYVSLSSFPTMAIDNHNKVFIAFAGATTLVDANNFNLRHVFGRDGVVTPTGTVSWQEDTLVDLTGDWIQYNFAECMYPFMSPTTDAKNVYILFQKDDFGGSFVKSTNTGYQGQTSPDDNFMTMLTWAKPVWVGNTEKQEKPTFSVAQNFPNPVNGITRVNVYLQNPGTISFKVTNLTGQTLMNMEKSDVQPGVSQFVVDGSSLSSGIYFYTVSQGDKSITKKMIVQ